MAVFRLKRFYPQKLEIEVTPQQLISMFPIELQEHPFMGEIIRVWKTEKETFSPLTAKKEDIIDLTKDKKHIQMKKEKMLEILQSVEKFKIILYYEDKEDLYEVEKIYQN